MKNLKQKPKEKRLSKISPSTRTKDLYQIFIDDEFLCSISGNDLLESRLAVGDKLNSEDLENLLYKSLKGKMSSAVLRYLGSRPHSENEIRQYIKKKLYAQYKETESYKTLDVNQLIEEILEKLRNLNYINDEEFSQWLVKQRTSARKPKSKLAIRAELQSKGIPPDLISSSLDQINPKSEQKMAETVAKKKLKALEKRFSEYQELKLKLSQHLISKGYSWDIVQSVVDSILKPF